MKTATASDYEHCVLGNYGTPMGELARGEGVHVWDAEGRRYLDFSSGIAVTALGHCHPDWVQAVQQQVTALGHTSNLFAHAGQGKLARKLCEKAGPGKIYFCNSGAEANEACLKLARLHGRKLTGEEGRKFKVVTATNGFHGRTFGAIAATPQEKIQGGFRPMLEGFAYGKLNDLASFEALIDGQTAAIFVESIQGEGGLTAASDDFLRGLRKLCDMHDLLLIIDEVQCGIGRAGTFFAHEPSGVKPDVIAMAKGLGGGFPIGAVWIAEPYAGLFTPGSHGTTFGGSPLACSAALAVLEVIERDSLTEKVHANWQRWKPELEVLRARYPELILEVRGRGYMAGLQLSSAPRPFVLAAMEAGLLTVPAGNNVMRLLPPLIATFDDLMAAMEILDGVFAKAAAPAPEPLPQNT